MLGIVQKDEVDAVDAEEPEAPFEAASNFIPE
jgi:hypothetical protein